MSIDLTIRSRAFSSVKELMAADKLSDATAAAMVPELLQQNPTIDSPECRGLTPQEANRIVNLVSLGKANNLFRHGNRAHERQVAMEQLAAIIKAEKTRGGQPRFRFSLRFSEAVALAAIDELAVCMCPECSGARVVPMYEHNPAEGRQPMVQCPMCHGSGAREYTDDDRRDAVRETAESRSVGGEEVERCLPRSPAAVSWARTKLLEAERVAVEETGRMLERW